MPLLNYTMINEEAPVQKSYRILKQKSENMISIKES